MIQEVGRYQLGEELTSDATGIVYKAVDPRLGRSVAVRSFRLEEISAPDEEGSLTRARLVHEVQAAEALIHPNIVAIYDAFEQDNQVYIVTEYVEGQSLAHLLRDGEVPGSEALLQILQEVASALDYAHRNGVVHRDIRPANILISRAFPGELPLAKIADFGVAKFISHDLTQNGSLVSTPDYLSPEQIQDTTIDGRSDQFSFGVVIYELLTGTKPFSANQLAALFYAICKQNPPAANQLNPTLSAASAKVLRRALMKDPAQRFASCGEFIGALSVALAEAPVPEAAATTASSRTSPVIIIPDKVPVESLGGGLNGAPYELPTRVRRHRADEDLQPEPHGPRSSGTKKLLLILLMFFAIGATIIFIVLSNSGPTVPVQVLDTRSGPMAPPPEGMEVKNSASGGATRTAPLPVGPTRRRTESAQSDVKSVPGLSSSGATTPGSPPAANGYRTGNGYTTDVELLTEPPGAKMVVDGRSDLTCNAPCTLNLPNGRHTVSGELSGFNIARRIFNVPQDDSIFVNLGKSMGVLVVTSTQSGCAVLVDGHQSGYTPATLHLTAGSHRIAVVSRATRHEETVQVQTDGFDVERFICQ